VINQKYFWLEILKFNELGLITAIVQDADDNSILMLIMMDKNSLKEVIDSGKFKRESTVRSIFYDCDTDALLIKVEQNDCKRDNLNWIAYG